jgi:hypothetical protein
MLGMLNGGLDKLNIFSLDKILVLRRLYTQVGMMHKNILSFKSNKTISSFGVKPLYVTNYTRHTINVINSLYYFIFII